MSGRKRSSSAPATWSRRVAARWDGQDVWGRRKLAYEIDKKTDGVYHLLSFSTDGETLDEISRVLKIDDNVMRHLATRRYRPGSTQPVAVGGPGARMSWNPSTPRWRRRMPQNINSVTLIGNLTEDPELRHTPSGTAVTTLRIAVNDRVKRGEEWTDAAYYFDVTVWGRQAENCAQYLAKGRPVGVDGQAHVARVGRPGRHQAAVGRDRRRQHPVPRRPRRRRGEGGGQQFVPQGAAQSTDDFPAAATADDDIPF